MDSYKSTYERSLLSTMNREIHFLGWERPVVDLAVDYLTADHTTGALDLAQTLIVVPTAHSGRRLREKLALYANRKGTVVFPGLIVTPSYLVSVNQTNQRVITNGQSTALWTHLLLSIEFKEFSALFPASPTTPNFDWAFGVARQLTQLRDTLADYGYQFADVVRVAGAEFEEKERWKDLLKLEKEYLRKLKTFSLVDRAMAVNATVAKPYPVSDIKRIVTIAVPDPVPLSTRVLGTLSQSILVDICVYAPTSLVDHFDDWGRPIAEKWLDFQIEIPEERIYLVGSPNQQADKVLNLLHAAAHDAVIGQISVGVPDEGVIPYLENAIRDSEISSYFPGGLQVKNHELFLLISSFQKFLRHWNYDAFSSFIRHPEVLDFVVREDRRVSPLRLLRMMDEFQNTYLPSDFGEMVRRLSELDLYHDLKIAVTLFQKLRNRFAGDQFVDVVLKTLSRLFNSRELNLNVDDDRIFRDVATLFIEHLSCVGDAQLNGLNMTPFERLEILLESLKDQRFYPECRSDGINLLGWLELLWEDAPQIVISGMNNGIVPDAIVGDPYLPESLRKLLNMKDNEQRFARDAYILAAITNSRKRVGNVDIVIAKTNDLGEPLKPSRLLFLCDDSTLPTRAQRLFGQVRDSRPMPPHTNDLKLRPKPPENAVLSTLSVTSFRDYLSCPFRFFLKHILRMETLDDRKTELDALDFGIICHTALEEFGRDESLRDSTDVEMIGSFLTSSAEKRIKNHFGNHPSVAVMVQLEAIKQRLEHAAKCQAKLRDDGWKITEVEKKIYIENAYGSSISIKGKVDRIDIHEATGQIRVIDYKTSDTAVPPQKAHFKKIMDVRAYRDYAVFNLGEKAYRWTDLQLPLYTLLLEQEMNQPVECGYFNLPKAVLESGVQAWPDLHQYLKQAKRCVSGVIDSVEKQVFWPATPRVDYDPFESILLNNPAALVDPLYLTRGGQ